MIAVQRHQHGGPRCQADHAAFAVVDQNMIIGPKRLPQAQHQAGHIIVHRVAHRKTQRDADNAGAAQHQAKQRGCLKNLQGHDQPGNDRGHPHRAGYQFGQKGIGRNPQPQPALLCQQVSQGRNDQGNQKRHTEQRQAPNKALHIAPQRIERRRKVRVDLVSAVDPVLDCHYPGDAARNIFCPLPISLTADGALQGDDAGFHRNCHRIQPIDRRIDIRQSRCDLAVGSVGQRSDFDRLRIAGRVV